MRVRRLLVAVGIVTAAVALPVAPAAAGCIEIDGVGCVNPSCTVARAVNVVLEAIDYPERVYCTL